MSNDHPLHPRRNSTEDICTYLEVLQRLGEVTWPYLDPASSEEMTADQFSKGMVGTT